MPALDKPSQSGQAESTKCLAVYKGHTDAVEDVAASPSGSRFASVSWDGNIRLWRTGRTECYCVLTLVESGFCQGPALFGNFASASWDRTNDFSTQLREMILLPLHAVSPAVLAKSQIGMLLIALHVALHVWFC